MFHSPQRIICFVSLAVLVGLIWDGGNARAVKPREYPRHTAITTTLFWVGEDASDENAYISNAPSAWDDDWQAHYGGVDSPDHRRGYLPAGFTPKENPFYCALPYSDFGKDGHKPDVLTVVPWARERPWGDTESLCKNRWLKITYAGKSVYAQWEDVGPFKTDDARYVFGAATPRSHINHHAGLDVSPAVHDYLSLSGEDRTDWQFVDDQSVPPGPWKRVITISQTSWKQ